MYSNLCAIFLQNTGLISQYSKKYFCLLIKKTCLPDFRNHRFHVHSWYLKSEEYILPNHKSLEADQITKCCINHSLNAFLIENIYVAIKGIKILICNNCPANTKPFNWKKQDKSQCPKPQYQSISGQSRSCPYHTVGTLGTGAHPVMFLCTEYNELWRECHRCGWYGTLMKIFQTNQNNRHHIYHWQVYIAVATARKVQKASLCTGVKGKKNAKQSLLQQGLGTMMKQHQQPWQ